MSGKHIEMFLVDGKPGGLTTLEVAGWTGHIIAGPRSELKRITARPEAERNGVYLLLADDKSAIDETRCYIGRTEGFAHRLRNHDFKKDWWQRLVLISEKGDSFNEGHWGYLEHLMVQQALRAKRASLDNGNEPRGRKLSEAQASDMEAFMREIQTLLPVLGVNVLRARKENQITEVRESETPNVSTDGGERQSPIFELERKKRGIHAKGQFDGDEFIVLAGSTCIPSWTGFGAAESTQRSYQTYASMHAKLLADGTIVDEGHGGVFTRDTAFSSPSTAGSVILGTSCNGRINWKYNGQTLGAWEDSGV